jgi:hypothetical protein
VSSAQSSINKLPSGWYLGSCVTPAFVSAKLIENTNSISANINSTSATISEKFNVIVSPNPSVSDFKILVQSSSKEVITIQLQDVSGRVIGSINNVKNNQLVSVGNQLIAGIYFAEVRQGRNKKIIRLIKL